MSSVVVVPYRPASLWGRLAGPSCTRVVRLHPETDTDARVEVSLVEVDLANDPQFEAISYRWGRGFSQKKIRVNGTRSLLDALVALRHKTRDRDLWVDALSIAQDDEQEKACHIQLIGKIFQQASTVIACVGIHDPSCQVLTKEWHFPDCDKIEDFARRSATWRPLKKMFNRSSLVEHEARCAEFADCMYEAHAQILWKFLESPYWHRTWVQQELIFAQQIELLCGRDLIAWEQFLFNLDGVLDYISGKAESRVWVEERCELRNEWTKKLRRSEGLARLEYVLRKRNRHRGEVGYDNLLVLINRFSRTNQYLPHDRVYAFLSMERRHWRQAPLQADYSISLGELFAVVLHSRYVRHLCRFQFGHLPDLPGRWKWSRQLRYSKTWPLKIMAPREATAYCLLRDLRLDTGDMMAALEYFIGRAARDDYRADLEATANAIDFRIHGKKFGGRYDTSYSTLKLLISSILGETWSNRRWRDLCDHGFVYAHAPYQEEDNETYMDDHLGLGL